MLKTPKTPLKEFLSAINPIDTDGWLDMRWYARCYEIFKVRLNTRNKITIFFKYHNILFASLYIFIS